MYISILNENQLRISPQAMLRAQARMDALLDERQLSDGQPNYEKMVTELKSKAANNNGFSGPRNTTGRSPT